MAVYTHAYTATHIYTHTQRVALIKLRYFICYGVGQVYINLPFPKPVSSNINKTPRMNMVSHQATTNNKNPNSFSRGR